MIFILYIFQERYGSFKSGIGAKIADGTATLEDMDVRNNVFMRNTDPSIFNIWFYIFNTWLLFQQSTHILQEYIKKNGEPKKTSGKQEHFESMLNYYV